jgi:hypothetical protein
MSEDKALASARAAGFPVEFVERWPGAGATLRVGRQIQAYFDADRRVDEVEAARRQAPDEQPLLIGDFEVLAESGQSDLEANLGAC